MFFKRITDVSDPTYHEGIKLYRISFPDHEQREASSQTQILQDDEYHFNAIYDEDIFVGLICIGKMTGSFISNISAFFRICETNNMDRKP